MALTLQDIRIQLNLPTSTSDAEVIKLASEKGIEIDMTGIKNTADVVALKTNLGGSVFGGNNAGTAANNTLNFGGTASSSGSFHKIDISDGLLNFNKNNPLENSGLLGEKNKALPFGMKKFELKSSKPLFGNMKLDLALFYKNYQSLSSGKDVAPEDGQKWEFKNGQAFLVDIAGEPVISEQTGKQVVRPACLGEEGYVKDGESIDERLRRMFPSDFKKAESPEQKAELLERYFKGYFDDLELKGKSREEISKLQQEDFVKLLKNSDQKNSEYGMIMGATVMSLRTENRVKAANSALNMAQNKKVKRETVLSLLNNIEKGNDDKNSQAQLIELVKQRAAELGINSEISLVAGNKVAYCDTNQCNLISIVDLFGDDNAIENLHSQMNTKDENGNSLFNKDAQLETVSVIARHATTEEQAIAAADATKEVDTDIQTSAVKRGYENIKEQGLGVYHESIANNIALYDSKNTTNIAEIVIKNDDKEHSGAQNMSNHAHETDVSVQKDMVKLLMGVGCEKVDNNLAAHSYDFDPTNMDDVMKMLKESGYDSTKKVLEEAKAKYEEEAKSKAEIAQQLKEQESMKKADAEKVRAQAQAQDIPKDANPTSKVDDRLPDAGALKHVSTSRVSEFAPAFNFQTLKLQKEELKVKTTKEKIEYVRTLDVKKRKEVVGQIVETSSYQQLKNLVLTGLKNDVIKYLISKPSPQNNAKLEFIKSCLSPSDLKILEKLLAEKENVNPFIMDNKN